jgi:hypothetical protein
LRAAQTGALLDDTPNLGAARETVKRNPLIRDELSADDAAGSLDEGQIAFRNTGLDQNLAQKSRG